MQRRELRFENFAEINQEVDRLLESGCDAAGNWDLAQICKHLALAMSGSVMGFPGRSPWFVRHLLGPIYRRRVFRNGRLPDAVPTNQAAIPKPGGDPQRAAKQLARAIERFETHDGPLAEHPLLGRLTPQQWRSFHLIHAAHHLGFLVPKS